MNSQNIAEQYLDEMLEAESTLNYDLFIHRFEERDVINFGASKFKKDMHLIREDLGHYQDRAFLGEIKGISDPDHPERHPNGKRYIWKGIFDKNEVFMIVGIHEREGVCYVNEFIYK